MERCQYCGRHPAKRITIGIRRGFFWSRRHDKLDGTYCRDCALAAEGARGKIHAWVDTGDLPPEVKDEPWMRLKVACPHCRETFFALSGPVKCAHCERAFVVGSCVACGAVHAIKTKVATSSASIPRCRVCKQLSEAPLPVRNWPVLLIGQAIAEVAADIAMSNGDVSETERQCFRDTLGDFRDFSAEAVRWLDDYFQECVQGKSTDALSGCIAHCRRRFRKEALGIGVAIAEADGPITPRRWQALVRLSGKLGLDPKVDLRDKRPMKDSLPLIDGDTWWAILRLPPYASIREIKAAYRHQALKHHPDRLNNASPRIRTIAEGRMKTINAAFAEALLAAAKMPTETDEAANAAGSRTRRDRRGTKYNASRWGPAASSPPHLFSTTHPFQGVRRFSWRQVLRAVILISLVVAVCFCLWILNVKMPNWWNDPSVCAYVVIGSAGVAGVAGALFRRGILLFAWTTVIVGAVVLASFWYRGLREAILYEIKHAHDRTYER